MNKQSIEALHKEHERAARRKRSWLKRSLIFLIVAFVFGFISWNTLDPEESYKVVNKYLSISPKTWAITWFVFAGITVLSTLIALLSFVYAWFYLYFKQAEAHGNIIVFEEKQRNEQRETLRKTPEGLKKLIGWADEKRGRAGYGLVLSLFASPIFFFWALSEFDNGNNLFAISLSGFVILFIWAGLNAWSQYSEACRNLDGFRKELKNLETAIESEDSRVKRCRRVLARYLTRLKKDDYDISRLEALIDEGIAPEDLEDDILAALGEQSSRNEEGELYQQWDLEGDLEAADIEGRVAAVEKVVTRQKEQIAKVEGWVKQGRTTDREAKELIEKINRWAETTIQKIMEA